MSKKKSSRSKNSRTKATPQKTNSIWLVGGLILIAVLAISAFLFLRQDQPAQSLSGGNYPLEITVAEAAMKRDQGAYILDVREPDEWQEAHIPDSTLIPLGDLPNRINEVPKDQEVVVVCRSGNRSQSGRDILLNAGYKTVTSMDGGLNEWKTSGFETVSGP